MEQLRLVESYSLKFNLFTQKPYQFCMYGCLQNWVRAAGGRESHFANE